MVSPNIWGPPIWSLFHTLTFKLKEENFNVIGKIVYNYIKRICYILPCNECSSHCKIFFSRIKENDVNTKQKLINTFYIFHNEVNKRKNKPLFKFEDIGLYKNHNLINDYNNFARFYSTKGNLSQINEEFHRKRLLLEFRKWLMSNINNFII